MLDSGTQAAALLARIESLERQNRRGRMGLMTLALAGGCCLLVAANAARPGTVEADRFVLRDKEGKARAALEMGATGPRLVLKNAEETDRASLAFNTDGNPILVLTDEQGTDKAVLGVNKEGYPSLVLAGEETRRLVLGVASTEQGLVSLDKGVERLNLVTNKNGDGLLLFRDGQKKARSLVSGYGADAGFMVFDPEGKNRLSAILDKGKPKFELRDAEGKSVFLQPAAKGQPPAEEDTPGDVKPPMEDK